MFWRSMPTGLFKQEGQDGAFQRAGNVNPLNSTVKWNRQFFVLYSNFAGTDTFKRSPTGLTHKL